jgi:PAS domain S-box-containing protein
MKSTPETLYPLILDSIEEGVFTVDAEFRLTYLNEAAERITGMRREEALGRRCYEVLRGTACQSGCPLKRSLETGEPQQDVRVSMLNSDMEPVPISVSTTVMKDRLGRLIGGVEIFRDVSEIEALRKELSGSHGFGDMVGASPAMREIFQLIPDVAASEASVLVQGASGTGKELIARAIHDQSSRLDGPFVRVNCGALPDTLLESELFGHVRGAFTDARRDKPGRFQQAHGGTLFLDEVGDLSAAFQVKLLRALQEGEIQPLGGTETLTVDVRVVSATNHDLGRLIQEGSFREDLYYRLCVIPVQIPPLRERREDIIPLLEHYIARFATRTGKPIRGVSAAALQSLVDYDYPGNVRELTNIIERAFALCHGGQIELTHLPPAVRSPEVVAFEPTDPRPGSTVGDDPPISGFTAILPRNLKPSERKAISLVANEAGASTSGHGSAKSPTDRPEVRALIELLNANGWNRGTTASALGISRGTLWRRMKEYGLI